MSDAYKTVCLLLIGITISLACVCTGCGFQGHPYVAFACGIFTVLFVGATIASVVSADEPRNRVLEGRLTKEREDAFEQRDLFRDQRDIHKEHRERLRGQLDAVRELIGTKQEK